MDVRIDSRNIAMTPRWKREIEKRMAAREPRFDRHVRCFGLVYMKQWVLAKGIRAVHAKQN